MKDTSLLVDAIIGRGFGSMEFANQAVNFGLARFTGNQWNEDWEWDRRTLSQLGEDELIALRQLQTEIESEKNG